MDQYGYQAEQTELEFTKGNTAADHMGIWFFT